MGGESHNRKGQFIFQSVFPNNQQDGSLELTPLFRSVGLGQVTVEKASPTCLDSLRQLFWVAAPAALRLLPHASLRALISIPGAAPRLPALPALLSRVHMAGWPPPAAKLSGQGLCAQLWVPAQRPFTSEPSQSIPWPAVSSPWWAWGVTDRWLRLCSLLGLAISPWAAFCQVPTFTWLQPAPFTRGKDLWSTAPCEL